MIHSISLYTDRSHKKSLSETLRTFMQKHQLISPRDDCVSFCGLIATEKHFYLFLPRQVNVELADTPDKKADCAILVMKTVEKYHTSHSTGTYNDSEEQGELNLGVLSIAKELLEDYMLNGLYIHKETKKHNSLGRINWKQTISKKHPFKGKSGVPVYPEVHSHITHYKTDSAIALIQAEVIRELDDHFSWWITGKADSKISQDLYDHKILGWSLEEKKRHLRNELQNLYSDREIRLLKHLLLYLESNRGVVDGHLVTGIKKFHFVWEEMLRKTLPNVINLNQQLPAPFYMDSDGKSESGRGMITDIIMSKDNITIVADAKYYHARSHSSAPGWSDLVKQFFYAKAIQCIRPEHSVKNLFIFPGREDEYGEGPLQRVQMMSPEKELSFDDEFLPIDCFYAPPAVVMRTYTKNKNLEDLSILFKKKHPLKL